ncbi:MAG: hypothetical protein ACOX4F_03655 [Atopobiaceae bacterium]|jgi:hypothetical protein
MLVNVVVICLVLAGVIIGVRRLAGATLGKRDCCSGNKVQGGKGSGKSGGCDCCH